MRIHPPALRFHRFTRLAPLAFALVCAGEAAAQQPTAGHRVRVGSERPSGATTVTPQSGPAGTVIAVKGEHLPRGVPVQIMIGALRSGFEVVGGAVSDDEGRLAGSGLAGPGTFPVTVPAWVERDRSYLLILTDRSYNPLAVADVFYPTDENGLVLRKGLVEYEEGACHTLTNDDQEIYFLLGDFGTLSTGDLVSVEGRVIDSETCGPGPTIQVVRVVSSSEP